MLTEHCFIVCVLQVMVLLVAPPLSSFVLTADREEQMSVIFNVILFTLFDFHTHSSGNLRNGRENSIIMKKT